MLDAPDHGLAAARHADAAVGRADVGLHRVDGQEALVGDLLVAEPQGQQAQDLGLARGEPDVLAENGVGTRGIVAVPVHVGLSLTCDRRSDHVEDLVDVTGQRHARVDALRHRAGGQVGAQVAGQGHDRGVVVLHEAVEVVALAVVQTVDVVEDHVGLLVVGSARIELDHLDRARAGVEHAGESGVHDLVRADDRRGDRALRHGGTFAHPGAGPARTRAPAQMRRRPGFWSIEAAQTPAATACAQWSARYCARLCPPRAASGSA